jgi:hypothetical protein
VVTEWKKENGLESYFNCPLSPDFLPIERAWQLPKQYVRTRPYWEDRIVKELAEEGWATVQQTSINRWVDQIPQILKDCIPLRRLDDHRGRPGFCLLHLLDNIIDLKERFSATAW